MKKIFKQAVAYILKLQAQALLKRHPKTKLVIVGGNIGKTGTKDAIFALLSDSDFRVRRSLKSFNSEIGLPLSILGLPNAWGSPLMWAINILKGFKAIFEKDYPDILVLELGADKKGDIASAAQWLKADVLVLTLVPELPVHVENFKNKEELFEEKRNLIKLLKDDSLLLYDSDSPINKNYAGEFKGKKYSYGFDKNADYRILKTQANCRDGLADAYVASLNANKKKINLTLKENIGWQRVKSALAAIAVAEHFSLTIDNASEKLDALASKGRMRLLPAMRNAKLIDDTYNASPKASLAALEVLSEFDCIKGRKIAVLADMLELGKFAPDAHKEVLSKALEVSDAVYLLGPLFKKVAQEFPEEKMHLYAKGEHDKLALDILEVLQEGDLVLLKGSQSMRMEKVAVKLLSKDSNPKDLLVRQEKEWLKK